MRLPAVDVIPDKPFKPEVPKRLLDSGFQPAPFAWGGMTADGKRFLFTVPQDAGSAPAPFTMLLNRHAGLQK
jgi:hypothetical protein